MDRDLWPALPYAAWRETCANLQLRTQIVGKIRLALTPWLNHSWHVTQYVTARGLTTGPIPYEDRIFKIEFDFIDHRLIVQSSDACTQSLALVEQPVADFYRAVMTLLRECRLEVRINRLPNEVQDPIPFDEDHQHRAYDALAVERFWRALVQIDRVFRLFRSGFLGKVSPVHFFWGSFDLAVTRFSGRPAPLLQSSAPGLPVAVAREAYSHEVSSAGFWPGGSGVEDAAFYSYAYPQPAGFGQAEVEPAEAYYHQELGQFLLPYEVVRNSRSPDDTLLTFLQSTYQAAAERAGWDRTALECALGVPNKPRSVTIEPLMTQLSADAVAELATLNRMLQQLHSHILDVERQANPGLTGAALLNRLLTDPAWAWLRGLSSLMADIDHVLAQKEAPSERDRAVAAAHIRGLLFGQGDLSNEQFLTRYRPLLQLNPSLASLHGELKGLLGKQPAEPENESERLHARHQWAMRCRHHSAFGSGRA